MLIILIMKMKHLIYMCNKRSCIDYSEHMTKLVNMYVCLSPFAFYFFVPLSVHNLPQLLLLSLFFFVNMIYQLVFSSYRGTSLGIQ